MSVMAADCEKCRYLRRFRPLSQLLAQDLGTDDQQFVSELLKIMQEERQQQDAEAELKAKLLENRDVQWPYRPHSSDYCGLRETSGAFLVHELKNRGGSCGEPELGEHVAHPCSTCIHRRAGSGPARDQQVLAEMSQLAKDAAALNTSVPDQTQSYLQLIGTKKAFEAAQAFSAGRITGSPPEYLSTCAKYSTPGSVIPCVVRNPQGTCIGWTPRADALAPGTPTRPSLMAGLQRLPARPAKT